MRRLLAILILAPLAAVGALPVDSYADFENGSSGDALTPTILNNGTHGAGSWSIAGSNTKEVYGSAEAILRGPVSVSGTSYNDSAGTRGIRVKMDATGNYVQLTLPASKATFSVGMFISFSPENYVLFDRVYIGTADGGYFVCQNAADGHIRAHGDGPISTGSEITTITHDKIYWLTMQFVKTSTCRLSIYDPANWAFVGSSEVTIDSTGNGTLIRLGRTDNHGNGPGTSYDLFDDLIIDTTTARYPLLPPGVFYVRTDGNANNPGTTNSSSGAWAALSTANSRATEPGDVVRVQSGTYSGNVTVSTSGEPASPITWIGDSSPVIQGTITVSGAYRRFIGLTIDGQETRQSAFLLQTGCNACEFWHNTIMNTTSHGFRGDNGTGSQEENNCIFVGNYLTNNDSAFQLRGTNNLVAYSESYRDVVDFAVFSGGCNRFLNNWFHAQTGDPAGDGDHTDFWQNGVENGLLNHDHLFEANLQEDMAGENFHGSNLQVGGDGDYGRTIFRGNIWTNNGSYTYGGDNTGESSDWTNFTVYNETVINARRASASSANDSNWTATDQYWRNNLFYQAWGDSVSTATMYVVNARHSSDYNLFYDTGGSISYSATINAESHSLKNSNPQLSGYRLGASSPARAAGGPITTVTSANGSGTSFTVARPGCFVGINTNLFFYNTNLARGDTITVGTDALTVTDVQGFTVYVTPSFTWAQNDPVYWGSSTTPDMGAIPYSSTALTSATISQDGTTYTVTPTGTCRWVVFFQDGIPCSVATASPYTATIASGTVTARAYALYAQTDPVVTATEGEPPSPPAPVTLRATTVTVRGTVSTR